MREISCHDARAAAPFRGYPVVHDREPPVVHIREDAWGGARFQSDRPVCRRGMATRLLACVFMGIVGGVVGAVFGAWLLGRPEGILAMSAVYGFGQDHAVLMTLAGFVISGALGGVSLVLTRWTKYED